MPPYSCASVIKRDSGWSHSIHHRMPLVLWGSLAALSIHPFRILLVFSWGNVITRGKLDELGAPAVLGLQLILIFPLPCFPFFISLSLSQHFSWPQWLTWWGDPGGLISGESEPLVSMPFADCCCSCLFITKTGQGKAKKHPMGHLGIPHVPPYPTM